MPESDSASTPLRLLESDEALALLREISKILKAQNDRLARLETREDEKIGAHRGEIAATEVARTSTEAGRRSGSDEPQEGVPAKRQKHEEILIQFLREDGHSEAQIAALLAKESADNPDRPLFTKMSRKYLAVETLQEFGIEWELDSDPNYVLIKRWVPEYEQDFLWDYTKKFREKQLHPEFEFVRGPQKKLVSYHPVSMDSIPAIDLALPQFLQAPYDHRLWLGFLGCETPPSPTTSNLRKAWESWFSKRPSYNPKSERKKILDGVLGQEGIRFLIRDSDTHGNNRLYSHDRITEYIDEEDPFPLRSSNNTSCMQIPQVTWYIKGREILVDRLPTPASAPWRRTVLLEGLESTQPLVEPGEPTSDETPFVTLPFLFDQDAVILKHLQGGSCYRWSPDRAMVTFQFSWYKIVKPNETESDSSKTSRSQNSRWNAGLLYKTDFVLQEQVFTAQAIYRSDWDTNDRRMGLAGEQYWTMLIITPPYFYGKGRSQSNTRAPLNDVLIGLPQTLLQRAIDSVKAMTEDWNKLLNHIEEVLFKSSSIFTSLRDENLFFNDDNFTRSRSLWWGVDALDMFGNIMDDCVQHYGNFKDSIIKPTERLAKIHDELIAEKDLHEQFLRDNPNDNIEEKLKSAGYDRKKLMDEKYLIEESELVLKNFLNTKERASTMKGRAVELRNGLFSASSVVEARASTRLGENVKLLTYVSIFYAPLAFCTSLSVYGKSYLWVVILVVSVITYVIVFNLSQIVLQMSSLYNYFRDKAIESMLKDKPESSWGIRGRQFKELGQKKIDKQPSEWLILGYAFAQIPTRAFILGRTFAQIPTRLKRIFFQTSASRSQLSGNLTSETMARNDIESVPVDEDPKEPSTNILPVGRSKSL